MDQVTLRAGARNDIGTRPARRLRRQGLVPAVVYGTDTATESVTVNARELYAALHTEAGANALINVEVEGGSKTLTVAREIQRHPVRGHLVHLDFIKVSLDEAIQAEVSLEYVGTPIGVRDDVGFVETIETFVLVEALPAEIPSSIELDISGLGVYDTLKVGDLPALEGVTYLDDEGRPLVTVLLPKAPTEEELEEVEEDLELAEGEEAEAVEEDAAPAEAED